MAIIDELNNLQTSIVTVKKVLADNINAKGVSVSENDTLTTLSNAVKDIPQEGGGGISFEVIGYPVTPQYIQDGIDYAKTIQDNWDASITSCQDKYKGNKQLVYFPLVDTSNVTTMSGMFSGCTSLQYVPQINTSNVTNMSNMFNFCGNLASLDLSNFDTSNVTTMYYMFNFCDGLISLDLSSFNTSNVTSMSCMFGNCSGLTSLNVSNFNTSGITNMSYMFTNCNTLTSLDLSSFDTSKVTDMSRMFNNCNSLTSLDLSNFDTSNVTNMSRMFDECNNLTKITIFGDASKVTSYDNMFRSIWTTNGLLTVECDYEDAWENICITNRSTSKFPSSWKLQGCIGTNPT
jgi:surface protein